MVRYSLMGSRRSWCLSALSLPTAELEPPPKCFLTSALLWMHLTGKIPLRRSAGSGEQDGPVRRCPGGRPGEALPGPHEFGLATTPAWRLRKRWGEKATSPAAPSPAVACRPPPPRAIVTPVLPVPRTGSACRFPCTASRRRSTWVDRRPGARSGTRTHRRRSAHGSKRSPQSRPCRSLGTR